MGEQTEVGPFDVFISYARKDNETGWVTALRDRLVRDTQSFGARIEVFFDTDSIRDGDQWRDRILKARW